MEAFGADRENRRQNKLSDKDWLEGALEPEGSERVYGSKTQARKQLT
jgi:hypothetical protein